jgi:hypothetical protein
MSKLPDVPLPSKSKVVRVVNGELVDFEDGRSGWNGVGVGVGRDAEGDL